MSNGDGYNIYYDPEKFGLRIVSEIEYSDAPYEFDMRVVWVDAEGKLYTLRDSGCSCPSPFGDVTGVKDLKRLTSLETLESEYREELNDNESLGYYKSFPSVECWQEFRNKVAGALEALAK